MTNFRMLSLALLLIAISPIAGCARAAAPESVEAVRTIDAALQRNMRVFRNHMRAGERRYNQLRFRSAQTAFAEAAEQMTAALKNIDKAVAVPGMSPADYRRYERNRRSARDNRRRAREAHSIAGTEYTLRVAAQEVRAHAIANARHKLKAVIGRVGPFRKSPFATSRRNARWVYQRASKQLAAIADSDGDGIFDRFDRCPKAPPMHGADQNRDGCSDSTRIRTAPERRPTERVIVPTTVGRVIITVPRAAAAVIPWVRRHKQVWQRCVASVPRGAVGELIVSFGSRPTPRGMRVTATKLSGDATLRDALVAPMQRCTARLAPLPLHVVALRMRFVPPVP